jgi:NAD(P)H dehydrogenase (quinone)
MPELAEEVSKQAGKTVVYNDLPSAEFEAVLQSFGLPQMFVDAIVDASVKASKGELNSSSQDLSRLIGRKTTSVAEAVTTALQAR